MAGWEQYLDIQNLKKLVLDDEERLSWRLVKTNLNAGYDEMRRTIPGFFTPYKSQKDFALTLISPILAPFALSILSTLLTAGAILAGIVCVGSLLFAGAATVLDMENRDVALNLALGSAAFAIGCALLASLTSLVTTVVSLVALSYLATRSSVSIAKHLGLEYCAEENSSDEEDSNDEIASSSFCV